MELELEYDFDHKCAAMPERIDFFRMKGATVTVFTEHDCSNVMSAQAFSGFKYCPYCGMKVVEDE